MGTSMKFGYFTDIGTIKFDDESLSSWIQLMPLGEYKHTLYGKVDITHNKVEKFVDNFRNNVRGIPLDIDYDHKAHTGKAAGWIEDVQDRGFDGLWGQVKWTQPAYDSLKAGEYKYFSPEFVDEWEHPQNGKYENVLLGGAITNRPFLKDIQPINLHEVIRASEGGPVVDPKLLRRALGLAEDATDEEVEAAVAKLASGQDVTNKPEAGETGTGAGDTPSPEPAPTEPPAGGEPVQASENAETKRLSEELVEVRKQLAEVVQARRLTEVKLQFNELNKGKYALSPAVTNKAQQMAIQLSEDKGNTFMGLLKEILDGGIVELGERGGNPNPTANQADPSKMLDELVAKRVSDGKVEYIDALEAVYADNPTLYEQYRQQQIGGGV